MACDANGRYELRLPADTTLTIRFSFTGMVARTEQVRLSPARSGAGASAHLRDPERGGYRGPRERESGLEKIDPKLSPDAQPQWAAWRPSCADRWAS